MGYLIHPLGFFVCFNDFIFNFYYNYWFFKNLPVFLNVLLFFLNIVHFFFYASNYIDNYFVITFQYLYHLIFLRTALLFILPADLTCGRFSPSLHKLGCGFTVNYKNKENNDSYNRSLFLSHIKVLVWYTLIWCHSTVVLVVQDGTIAITSMLQRAEWARRRSKRHMAAVFWGNFLEALI